MPGPLIIAGKIAIKDGKPLIDDDVSCCCPVDCGCDCVEFTCCNVVETFVLGAAPTCSVANGDGDAEVEARWQWDGCRFTWEVRTVLSQQAISMSGDFTYPANSGCDAPVGAWSAGTFGNDKEFAPMPNIPARQCLTDAATVTIAKTANGYSFTVAGVSVDPDWDGSTPGFGPCDDACDLLEGTWVVEC